jgi:hypothetical protein
MQQRGSEFQTDQTNMERNSYGQPLENPRKFSFWTKLLLDYYLKVTGMSILSLPVYPHHHGKVMLCNTQHLIHIQAINYRRCAVGRAFSIRVIQVWEDLQAHTLRRPFLHPPQVPN